MNFGFNEMQVMLGDDARRLLTNKCTHQELYNLLDSAEGYSPELWQEMSALGWMGLLIPEEYGGVGLTLVDLAPILEQWGENLAPGPFIETAVVFSELLMNIGSTEQKNKYLTQIVEGNLKCTLALLEKNGQWDETGIHMLASSNGELNGEKELVAWAAQADVLLVSALVPDAGITLFLVPADAPGLSILPCKSMDVSTRQYRVLFNHVQGELLGEVGKGWDPLAYTLFKSGAAAASLDILGNTRGVLTKTINQLKERMQYGRVIGSNQALKHYAVDLHIKLEQGISLVYYAAMAVANNQADAVVAVSRAKAFIGEIGRWISQRSIQLHGANGFTWEYDIHLHLKRVVRLANQYGTSNFHRERLMKLT